MTDKRLASRNGSALLALLLQYLRPHRPLVAIVAVTQLAGTSAALSLPTIDAAIIDDGVAKGDISTIVKLGGLMVAVSVVQLICSAVAARVGLHTGMRLGRDLRSAMFRRVTGFSAQQVAKFGAPSLLTRTMTDVRHVQELVLMSCTILITAAITCIGGMAIAIQQDTALSWVLVVGVPVVAVANYWIMSRSLADSGRMQKLLDNINGLAREQLSGVRVIRAFAREPLEQKRFADANAALSDATLAAGRWQVLIQPVTTLVINLSSIALIWFGGLRIDEGRMQVGSLVAFICYAMQILVAILMASSVLTYLPRASVCAERISEILSTPTAITNSEYPARPTAMNGVVRLESATFHHPGADRPVLKDVSFAATPGTTTAIVGSTGSGKSTLVSLICRLFDVTDGSVTIDGIDVREHDIELLRSMIGLVPQRAYLFTGTVADNLRYGKADATETEMWEALRVAAADGFVRAHPDGLQMQVTQGGMNFSGGQRQRLAIARAVIRRPAVYLFDDSFSALDVHTQVRVQAALREVSAHSTVITVSQRITAVAEADQVIIVDDGTVLGIGTHESLLTDCPVYAEFVGSHPLAPVGSLR